MFLKLTKRGYSMSKYSPHNDMYRYGWNNTSNVITYGMVKAFWLVDDYRNLLRYVSGDSFCRPGTHFFSMITAQFYNLDFTTPYEVSMWLKQQIREENK